MKVNNVMHLAPICVNLSFLIRLMNKRSLVIPFWFLICESRNSLELSNKIQLCLGFFICWHELIDGNWRVHMLFTYWFVCEICIFVNSRLLFTWKSCFLRQILVQVCYGKMNSILLAYILVWLKLTFQFKLICSTIYSQFTIACLIYRFFWEIWAVAYLNQCLVLEF